MSDSINKRVNPFEAFIKKVVPSDEKPIDFEINNEPDPVSHAIDEPCQLDAPEWVTYLDDESGCIYWYNTITGEARWAEEIESANNYHNENQIQQDNVEPISILITASPWEKYFDDDGNPYYYNKDTGVSQWELPIEEFISLGTQQLQDQPADYYSSLGFDTETSRHLSQKFSSANLKDALKSTADPIESTSFHSPEISKSIYSVGSFRTIRSARSVGLSAHKSPSRLGSFSVSGSVVLQESVVGDQKALKSKLSFILPKTVGIDDTNKPKTPASGKKSKSGFQMLKEGGATVLRKGTDDEGNIWIEYQSVDEGPIFYSLENSSTGQWKQPSVFNVIATVLTPKKPKDSDESLSSPSEMSTSMEVVDFFTVDRDEVLKLQTPLSTKNPANNPLFGQPVTKSLRENLTKPTKAETVVNTKAGSKEWFNGDSTTNPTTEASDNKRISDGAFSPDTQSNKNKQPLNSLQLLSEFAETRKVELDLFGENSIVSRGQDGLEGKLKTISPKNVKTSGKSVEDSHKLPIQSTSMAAVISLDTLIGPNKANSADNSAAKTSVDTAQMITSFETAIESNKRSSTTEASAVNKIDDGVQVVASLDSKIGSKKVSSSDDSAAKNTVDTVQIVGSLESMIGPKEASSSEISAVKVVAVDTVQVMDTLETKITSSAESTAANDAVNTGSALPLGEAVSHANNVTALSKPIVDSSKKVCDTQSRPAPMVGNSGKQSSAVSLKIQSIQAEAILEMEQLRKRLESAKLNVNRDIYRSNLLSSENTAPIVAIKEPTSISDHQITSSVSTADLNDLEKPSPSSSSQTIKSKELPHISSLESSNKALSSSVAVTQSPLSESTSTVNIEQPKKDAHASYRDSEDALKAINQTTKVETEKSDISKPFSNLSKDLSEKRPLHSVKFDLIAQQQEDDLVIEELFNISNRSSPLSIGIESLSLSELLNRSQVIKSTVSWICYFDLVSSRRFYKRQNSEFWQIEKPIDFDSFYIKSPEKKELSHDNSSTANAATPPGIETKRLSSPQQRIEDELLIKEFEMALQSEAFLTEPKFVDPPVPESSPELPVIASPQQAEADNDLFLSVTQLAAPQEEISRELSFVERHATMSLHSQYQRASQLEDTEAKTLLRRLERIGSNRMELNSAAIPNRKFVSISSMDKDEIAKVQSKCRHILEKCCALLDQVEVTPLEHIMNELQLLRSAIDQRMMLEYPYDLRHDGPYFSFAPAMQLNCASISLSETWNRDSQASVMQSNGWRRVSSPHARVFKAQYFYFHSQSNVAQIGEPFDIAMRKKQETMKREKWRDFYICTSIDQKILEYNGVELLEDEFGGYLFYCPMRGVYSSTGAFETLGPAMAIASNKNRTSRQRPASHTTKSSAARRVQDDFRSNIWKRLQMKDNEDRNRLVNDTFFMTTASDGFRETSTPAHATNRNRQSLGQSLSQSQLYSQSQSQRPNLSEDKDNGDDNFQLRSSLSHLQEFLMQSHLISSEEQTTAAASVAAGCRSGSTAGSLPSALLIAENIRKAHPDLNKQSDNFSILEEAFAVAKTELRHFHSLGSLNPDDRGLLIEEDMSEPNAAEETRASAGNNSKALSFEKEMDQGTYQRYENLIYQIYCDPENPVSHFELMEFLIFEGLGKAALAVFRRAMDLLKDSTYFASALYESAIGHVLSIKMSDKYYGFHEKYSSILHLIDSFPKSCVVLTHAASYYLRLSHFDQAEVLLLGALLMEPYHDFALMKYAQLLIQRGDLKIALRYLHRLQDSGHQQQAASSSSSSSSFSFIWGRIAKLQMAWIHEIVRRDDDSMQGIYQESINSNARDRVQSLALHSLASFSQSANVLNPTCLELYSRALQVDPDNAIANMGVASLTTIHLVHSRLRAVVVPTASNAVSSAKKPVAGANEDPPLVRPASAAGRGPAQAANKTMRPVSATAVGNNRTHIAAAATQQQPSALPESNAAAAAAAGPALQGNFQQIDANYRRCLAMLPNAKYRWIALLGYADFILCVLRDTKRAMEYYLEAAKISFSSEVWPIAALGNFYHYVRNDYKAAYRLYSRAMISRHRDIKLPSSESVSIDLTSFDSFLHSRQEAEAEERNQRQSRDYFKEEGHDIGSGDHLLVDEDEAKEALVLYLHIAYLLWDMGDYSAARRYAIACLHIQKTNAHALRCVGLISYFEGDKRLGLKYISAAADFGGQCVHILRTVAIGKAMKAQYSQAIAILERVVAATPSCVFSHRTLAVLLFVYGAQATKALYHLHMAYESSNQTDFECLRLKAQILMDQGSFKEARLCLIEALRIVPYDAICLSNVATCVQAMSLARHPGIVFKDSREDYSDALRRLTYDRLESLAHEKDPVLLYELSLLVEPSLLQESGEKRCFYSPGKDKLETHKISVSSLTRSRAHASPPATAAAAAGSATDTRKSTAAEFSWATSAQSYLLFQFACFLLKQRKDSSLPKAKLLLTKAAAKLMPNCFYYPLILHRLGLIAEAESDLIDAERLLSEATQAPQINPISLLRLIASSEEVIAECKAAMKAIKAPKGKRLRKKKKGKRNELEASATFSDFAAAERLGYFTPQRTIGAMETFLTHSGEEDRYENDKYDIDEENELEQQQEQAQAKEMALLLKRIMMHQRVLEIAQVRRFSMNKLFKDIAGGVGSKSTSAGLEKGKTTLVSSSSYVYLHSDWLERSLYSCGKCEDWATLFRSIQHD